jgi:hypothetical protein
MSGNILSTIFQWLGYAQYNASPPVATSGQVVPLQADIFGNLLVSILGAAGPNGGGGIGPTGAALSGLTNPIAVQLQNGVTDSETKNFVLINSSANSPAFTSPSDNIIPGGTGNPVGLTESFRANGRGTIVTFVRVKAELSNAGAWVTG